MKAIVVGSGAGGSMAARELARAGFDVTVLEAGKPFEPFSMNLSKFEGLRKAGFFFDARMIQLLFPAMRIDKTPDGMIHVKARAVGGTSTLATGNALRYDRYLQDIGINLDAEFLELEHEVPQSVGHRERWSEVTNKLFDVFQELGLEPQVTPKFMEDPKRCVACGKCVLGCKNGAKWTCDALFEKEERVSVVTGATVTQLLTENNRVTGVVVHKAHTHEVMKADLVILAAGGLGTPAILLNSGIQVQPTLFVDPVLCIAAQYPGAGLDRQLPMPFVSEQPDYILSPYFDWLSFYFDKRWRHPSGDIMSIMIKMADDSHGSYDGRRLTKPLTQHDNEVLDAAVLKVYEIYEGLGIPSRETFKGTLNAGHPGGCLPLTPSEAVTLHHEILPQNLYVADATLLPRSMGNPPILTIMALAKRIAREAAKQ